MPADREIIETKKAPAVVGPYSQAVRMADFVYTAGQIGLDTKTGCLVDGGIEAQTQQIMQNLSNVLEAAGSNLSKVIKTTIFVTNLDDFSSVNEIYGSFFSTDPPARSTVQVVALPLEASVEIEAVAMVERS